MNQIITTTLGISETLISSQENNYLETIVRIVQNDLRLQNELEFIEFINFELLESNDGVLNFIFRFEAV